MVASQIRVDYSPLKNICARPQKKKKEKVPQPTFFLDLLKKKFDRKKNKKN